ncbi:MAG: hypothetical protein GPOALKHO_000547 [Sodalis sp.]|nr:MAG: hypothetical protein GPOALKHO_000547 [Sodalis sp.]
MRRLVGSGRPFGMSSSLPGMWCGTKVGGILPSVHGVFVFTHIQRGGQAQKERY